MYIIYRSDIQKRFGCSSLYHKNEFCKNEKSLSISLSLSFLKIYPVVSEIFCRQKRGKYNKKKRKRKLQSLYYKVCCLKQKTLIISCTSKKVAAIVFILMQDLSINNSSIRSKLYFIVNYNLCMLAFFHWAIQMSLVLLYQFLLLLFHFKSETL